MGQLRVRNLALVAPEKTISLSAGNDAIKFDENHV
jgi:hypothetical protein